MRPAPTIADPSLAAHWNSPSMRSLSVASVGGGRSIVTRHGPVHDAAASRSDHNESRHAEHFRLNAARSSSDPGEGREARALGWWRRRGAVLWENAAARD
jgi:hypothetical protein